MTTTTVPVPSTSLPIGGQLLEAISRRDFDAFQRCLAANAHFRALVPAGPFELDGARTIADRFRLWFGGSDEYELLESTAAGVGSKQHLRWRIRMTAADAPHPQRIAEQHVFVTGSGVIESLDLLCSGFQSES